MPTWNAGSESILKRQSPFGPPKLTPEEITFSNAPQILAISGSFFAAAALVVLLRCYVRLRMLKVFGMDDYLMVVATLLAAATFSCFKIETEYGLGKHFIVMLMDPTQYMNFSKVLYIHSIIVMVGVSTVKISIAFFLLRLSTRTAYTRFLYGVIAFIVFMTIVCAMTIIFQCFPVEAAWDARLRPQPFGTGDAKCYSMIIFRNLGLMNSSFNILTDVLFATLPIPLIWQLKLNARTKVSLIIVLSLGWFACAAAIIKAIRQFNVLNEPDWTVHNAFNIWNYIEFTIGILAASLPTLKPLFNRLLETARGITSNGRTEVVSGYKASGYQGNLDYQKTDDHSNRSIALTSFARRDTTRSNPKNPYNVKITTHPTGLADKEVWDMLQANNNSDECILPLQYPEPSSNGIMMTREVRISEGKQGWDV